MKARALAVCFLILAGLFSSLLVATPSIPIVHASGPSIAVQGTAESTTSTSISLMLKGVTSGDCVAVFSGTVSGVSLNAPTDNQSDTYLSYGYSADSSSKEGAWHATVTSSGSLDLTATFSGTGDNSIMAYDITGGCSFWGGISLGFTPGSNCLPVSWDPPSGAILVAGCFDGLVTGTWSGGSNGGVTYSLISGQPQYSTAGYWGVSVHGTAGGGTTQFVMTLSSGGGTPAGIGLAFASSGSTPAYGCTTSSFKGASSASSLSQSVYVSSTSQTIVVMPTALAASTVTMSSVTDTESNSYTEIGTGGTYTNVDGFQAAWAYYAKPSATGTVTVTATESAANYMSMSIWVLSNVKTTGMNNSGAGGNSGNLAVPSFATSGTVVVAGGSADSASGTWGPGTGYQLTQGQAFYSTTGYWGVGECTVAPLSAATTAPISQTTDIGWAEYAVSFAQAPATNVVLSIKASDTSTPGGSASIVVSGCSTNSSSLSGNGAYHHFSVTPSCSSLTLTMPVQTSSVRYFFSKGLNHSESFTTPASAASYSFNYSAQFPVNNEGTGFSIAAQQNSTSHPSIDSPSTWVDAGSNITVGIAPFSPQFTVSSATYLYYEPYFQTNFLIASNDSLSSLNYAGQGLIQFTAGSTYGRVWDSAGYSLATASYSPSTGGTKSGLVSWNEQLFTGWFTAQPAGSGASYQLGFNGISTGGTGGTGGIGCNVCGGETSSTSVSSTSSSTGVTGGSGSPSSSLQGQAQNLVSAVQAAIQNGLPLITQGTLQEADLGILLLIVLIAGVLTFGYVERKANLSGWKTTRRSRPAKARRKKHETGN